MLLLPLVCRRSHESSFAPASFDTILNLFSPSNYQEFDRILKPGGQVIKVVPAASYLKELRQAFIQMILQNKSILMNVSLINFCKISASEPRTDLLSILNPRRPATGLVGDVAIGVGCVKGANSKSSGKPVTRNNSRY